MVASNVKLRSYVERKQIEKNLEIIEDHRRNAASKLNKPHKPKLRAWRAFVWTTAAVRIACFILIGYATFFIRYELLKYFIEPQGLPEDQRVYMATQLLPILLVLSVFGVVSDVLISFSAIRQNPKYISYLMVVTVFLTFFIFMFLALTASVSADPEETTVQVLGRATSTGVNYGMWEELQAEMKCCGFNGPEDWLNKNFAAFADPFYEANVIIPNNLEWLSKCTDKTGEIVCGVPPSCCVSPGCYKTAATTQKDLRQLRHNFENGQGAGYMRDWFEVEDDTHTTGCVAALSNELKWALSICNYAAIVLALFTFIMVVLLTTVMIYHDSIGHISKRRYCKIDPPQTDFLVRFFLEMDSRRGGSDLSELSSMEEIIKKELNS